MTSIEAFLRQLDDAWEHPWEGLCVTLEGVTAEEAAWQSPVYDDVTSEEGWPAPGSIHWQVAHITSCKKEYACHIRDRGGDTDKSLAAFAPSASFEDELAAMKEAHAWLRREMAALEDADLVLKANHKIVLDEWLAMVIRHDSWHAGQIAVARRLFRRR